ncbi:hypothetical protein BUALT_Bualt02G0008400 [Buddleja alternifolia]|uniref:Uncharacterized protein n=1 Tax=Buddleja alternifolia TaxID=168488 RepID=A0AAV6XX20_9LAMI|nr:hypothetical protein BUALT_Bualt02G0008400 [Buddleja alternifolia]
MLLFCWQNHLCSISDDVIGFQKQQRFRKEKIAPERMAHRTKLVLERSQKSDKGDITLAEKSWTSWIMSCQPNEEAQDEEKLCTRHEDFRDMVAEDLLVLDVPVKKDHSQPYDNTGGTDTWASLRRLLKRESDVAVSGFASASARFELDPGTVDEMVDKLKDYAKNLEKKSLELLQRKPALRSAKMFPNLIFASCIFFKSLGAAKNIVKTWSRNDSEAEDIEHAEKLCLVKAVLEELEETLWRNVVMQKRTDDQKRRACKLQVSGYYQKVLAVINVPSLLVLCGYRITLCTTSGNVSNIILRSCDFIDSMKAYVIQETKGFGLNLCGVGREKIYGRSRRNRCCQSGCWNSVIHINFTPIMDGLTYRILDGQIR